MPPPRVKTQYWDFVYNNETDETTESLKNLLTQWNIILDAAFQREVAPTTGTKHLQGWLKLDKRQYKSYLLNSILNSDEWENKLSFRPARNPKALMAYVMKDQEGAHGYWCKSLEERLKRQEEELKEQIELIKEAEKYGTPFNEPLEEYDYDDEGNEITWKDYDSIKYLNESRNEIPSIDTATKELLQEVENDTKKLAKTHGVFLSRSADADVISGATSINYRDKRVEYDRQSTDSLKL